MEAVPLEKAPKVAVYTPPNSTPWDDAVTMALEYAGIEYETLWDPEVLDKDLSEYEWIHLHHEDFTGQYSKFYLTYAGAAWLQEEVARNQDVARSHGYASVPALKKAVAQRIHDYVEGGGFLFAMCSATETLELALAGIMVEDAPQLAVHVLDADFITLNSSQPVHHAFVVLFGDFVPRQADVTQQDILRASDNVRPGFLLEMGNLGDQIDVILDVFRGQFFPFRDVLPTQALILRQLTEFFNLLSGDFSSAFNFVSHR